MQKSRGWTEIEMTHLGVVLAEALDNLETGEEGDFNMALGGRWVRISNDPNNDRIIISEFGIGRDRRYWH